MVERLVVRLILVVGFVVVRRIFGWRWFVRRRWLVGQLVAGKR
jgi:hypothetical protein